MIRTDYFLKTKGCKKLRRGNSRCPQKPPLRSHLKQFRLGRMELEHGCFL